jgi:hypothetical protein
MPTVIFGGGKIDITDRSDRLLGNINITDNNSRNLGYVRSISDSFITDYNNLLVSNSITKLFFPGKFRITNMFIIENVKPDNGDFTKTRHIITPYKIHYVYDTRHSHDLDLIDTTEFGNNQGSPTEVFRIDYGQIINSVYTYIRITLRTPNGTAVCIIQISQDGSNWTQIATASTTSSSEVVFELTANNINFRYIRFLTYNTLGNGYLSYLKVHKIVIYLNVM